eukprot:GHVR01057628.1.p1 GENE.GHVR01057628.1~~GHVR01057628.1.p1  ORF type:complete len:452 (+),score=127.82 GHVR01057628.1:1-1356(+)
MHGYGHLIGSPRKINDEFSIEYKGLFHMGYPHNNKKQTELNINKEDNNNKYINELYEYPQDINGNYKTVYKGCMKMGERWGIGSLLTYFGKILIKGTYICDILTDDVNININNINIQEDMGIISYKMTSYDMIGLDPVLKLNNRIKNGTDRPENPKRHTEIKFFSGATYVGSTEDFEYNGEGKVTDGSLELDALFKDGKTDGHASLRSEGELVYEGPLYAGVPHGRGRHNMSGGAYYDGEYFEGVREGEGVYVDKDGNKYEGKWSNGVPDDPQGVYTPKGGTRQVSKVVGGCLVGHIDKDATDRLKQSLIKQKKDNDESSRDNKIKQNKCKCCRPIITYKKGDMPPKAPSPCCCCPIHDTYSDIDVECDPVKFNDISIIPSKEHDNINTQLDTLLDNIKIGYPFKECVFDGGVGLWRKHRMTLDPSDTRDAPVSRMVLKYNMFARHDNIFT